MRYSLIGLLSAAILMLPVGAVAQAPVSYAGKTVLVTGSTDGLGRELAEFIPADSLAEARRLLAEQPFDLVLLDLGLPDGNGLELLDELQNQRPGLPVAVLSASEMDGHEFAGVSAALAKSRNDGQHFLHMLNRLLPAKETRDD